MSHRISRAEKMLTNKEDKALQRNVFARRHLDADLEAQQGLEKMHLQTIRNEKLRLQKELERMRGRGQRMFNRRQPVPVMNNTARLTQLRLNRDSLTTGGNRSLRTPAVGRSTSPVSGASSESKGSMDPAGRGRQTLELPAINPSNRTSRSPRNNYRSNHYEFGEDYLREQQMLEHKRNLSKKQEELSVRVGKFGEDFGVRKPREGSDEPTTRCSTEHSVRSDDGMTTTSDPTSSLPPPGRTNLGNPGNKRSNSFSDYDLKNIKQSITKRLVGEEKAGQGGDANLQDKQQLGRTASTTSYLGTAAKPRKKNLSVGNEPRPIDMVFDQETYAPDGSLRTVHMLPDPTESFEEAKKARYIRCKGPHQADMELTVNEIFAKDETKLRKKESRASIDGSGS